LKTISSSQESDAIADVFWRTFIALSNAQQQAVLRRLAEADQLPQRAQPLEKPLVHVQTNDVEAILKRLQGHGRGEQLTAKLLQSRKVGKTGGNCWYGR
jgi:hypothetical protein